MKNVILGVFSILVLFNLSCQPDKCCINPQPPVMTAEKNGAAWLLPIGKSTFLSNIISISTIGPYWLSTAKDSLSITLPYNGLGSYTPTDQQFAYTVFSNGVKTKYLLDTNFYNSFNITEFVTQSKPDPAELKAIFNLRFVDPAHTTSVTFSNGKFTAILNQ